MKKLSLDALEITSFETTPEPVRGRGTVAAHQQVKPLPPSAFGPCEPTDADFDCTYGCSMDTGCPDNCVIYSNFDCV